MAANTMTIDWSKMKLTESIDLERTFPGLALGPYRDPLELAKSIKVDVSKLRSISPAGRKAIVEERCARAGISPDGVPTFYIDRTRVME
jgi:hypothetical protein